MTEDEAKGKLCCGHPASAAAEYFRAGAPVDAPMHCAGSACMAWRWSVEPTESTASVQEAVAGTDGRIHVVTTPAGAGRIGRGRCGLAGSQ